MSVVDAPWLHTGDQSRDAGGVGFVSSTLLVTSRNQSRRQMTLCLAMCVWAVQACAVNSGDGGARDASVGIDANFGGGGGLAGVGGIGGFAAVGGFGGAGGAGGSAGVGGSCGVCPVSKIVIGPDPLLPCCTDDGRCGVTRPDLGQCFEENAPGLPDNRCPTGASGGSSRLPGCCTRAGECGVVLDYLGLGCVERTRAGMIPLATIEDRTMPIACWTTGDSDAGEDADAAICGWAVTGYCAANALCHVEADEPVCECPPGFADLSGGSRRGVACRDINECLGSPPVCNDGACINTEGGFVCVPTGD